MPRKTPSDQPYALPSREQILHYLATTPGKIGKREISRHFGVGGGARVGLKRLLKDLEDDGLLDRDRKAIHAAGQLPNTVVAEITGVTRDGDLTAAPLEWDEARMGATPRIILFFPKKMRRDDSPPPAVGDRVLLKTERDRHEPNLYQGRVLKVLSVKKDRTIGIFREDKARGGGRLIPVDKRAKGVELLIAPGEEGDAEDGDLIAVEVQTTRLLGQKSARVREVLGSGS